MAAGIAHEIRNPLASMSGSIQVLRQELPLSEEQAQLMDIVLRESERLNDTIRSFLAYARPQRFAVARLDVGKVVQDAALLLRNSADVRDGPRGRRRRAGRSGLVRGRREPDPPDRLEPGDQRAARDGRRRPPAAVGRRTEPTAPATSSSTVQDQGCGIPADELDGIFQPFRSSFEKGTGLGLAIVHRIVTDYSGIDPGVVDRRRRARPSGCACRFARDVAMRGSAAPRTTASVV